MQTQLRGGPVIRIDSHQHFWKLCRKDYGWLKPEQEILYRDYLPQDLEPILREHEIEYTIVVQAAPSIEETEFLLGLYKQHEFIAGVVGWLDLASPHFKEQFDHFLRHDGFIGIRPMLQDLKDEKWILRSEVKKNIEHLINEDFPIDILIYPRHLPVILELLQEFPQLRAVINHAAKPDIRNGITTKWKNDMKEVASFPNVMCKLSGLITEADHKNWQYSNFVPFVRHVVNVFGTDRIMFGSDWPVCLLAGSYSDVYKVLKKALPQNLKEDDFENIFGQNASKFYKLHP
jgi:L-fuconolactonase